MSKLSKAQRDALPLSDFGDPERRLFPIVDQDDVDSAAHLIGKAKNPEKVKARIMAIAKRKGLTIPDAWKATMADCAPAGRRSVVAFDLEAGGRYVEGDYAVYPNALLFEAGDYADRAFELTPEEQWAAVETFEPVWGNVEHTDFLKGRACEVRSIRLDESDSHRLRGEVAVPLWLDEQLIDHERRLSCEWDRQSKHLVGIGLVVHPRIPQASLVAAYAQFAGKRHSASDIADLQQIHDLATKQGASCPAGGERRTADGTDDEEGGDEDGGQTTSRMSRARRAPAHKDSPARKRSTGSMNLKEWILGKAQEDGVDLDSGDLAAAFAQQDDEARTKLAVLEEQNKALAAQVEAERTRVEQHEAAFARAAQDRREAEAATFAAQAVQAHRIAPAAQEALSALHVRCATLDSTATFSAAQATEQAPKSTTALLAELVAQLPDLSVFTTEHIKPDQVAALFTQDTTAGVTGGGPKDMTAERRAELLAKTQLGRSIAQQHRSNGKS